MRTLVPTKGENMKALARAIVHSSIAIVFMTTGFEKAHPEQGSEASPQPMIGMAAPGFELLSIGGDTLRLADLRGKFVVIHFGASW